MIKEIFIYTYFISLVLYWLFFWIPACEQYNERERTAFSSFFRSKTFREYVKLGIIVSALPILNIILAFITVGDVFACIDKGR